MDVDPSQPVPDLAEVVARLARNVEELTAEVRQLRATTPVQLVDVDQAAAHLGVSPRTLRRMVRVGKVPFRRAGRALRFNLADLARAA